MINILFISMFSLLTISCTSNKKFSDILRKPSSIITTFEEFQDKYCKEIPKFNGMSYSWPQILKNINNGIVKSVESFLCQFDQDAFSMSRGMSQSRSIQLSTPKHPRFLVPQFIFKEVNGTPVSSGFYHNDEYLIYSFNHPDYLGGKNIELLRYNPAEKLEKRLSLIDINFSQHPPKISTNSKKCSKCHGVPIRPLWNSFSAWPGAFNGNTKNRSLDEVVTFFEESAIGRYSVYRTKDNFNFEQGPPTVTQDLFEIFGDLNTHRIAYKVKKLKNYSQVIFPFIYGNLCLTGESRSLKNNIFTFFEKIYPLRDDLLIKVDQSTLATAIKVFGDKPLSFLKISKNKEAKLFLNFLYLRHAPLLNKLGYNIPEKIKKMSTSEIYAMDIKLRSLIKADYGMNVQIPHEDLADLANENIFNFPLHITDLKTVLFRLVIEGSGGYIGDWGTDILQEDYLLLFNTDHQYGVIDYLINSDPQIKEVLNKTSLFKYEQPEIAKNLSYKALFDLASTEDKELTNKLCNKIKQQAFNNTPEGKVKKYSIPSFDHISPMKKGQSCKSCHQNYIGNVDYYNPEGNSHEYPKGFLVCANCHSDKDNLISIAIPFDNEQLLRQSFLASPYWRKEFLYRISNQAKQDVKHMPPVFNLNPKTEEEIRTYIKNTK